MEKSDSANSVEDYLAYLSRRIRGFRAARGMTRKDLSRHSAISERYLAQLESGKANPSVEVLWRIADAMGVELVSLMVEHSDPSDIDAGLWRLLQGLGVAEQRRAHDLLLDTFGNDDQDRSGVALIGLRGAGKTTLGAKLGETLGVPFIRLGEMIEREGGMELWELFSLAGQKAYRRLERDALERIISEDRPVILEAGGSIVSERATFERLLGSFYTVWLRAQPEEHMERVSQQGDTRPMAGNQQAMADLRRILAERESDYGRADYALDTSARHCRDALTELIQVARPHLSRYQDERTRA